MSRTQIIWNECFKDTVEELTKYIAERKTLLELSEKLEKNEDETLIWLNSYFDLLNFEEEFIDEIISDKHAVIPNQNGVFKKRTELSFDDDIEEELKNALIILGKDWRELLVHKDIETGENIGYIYKTQNDIISEISKIIKEGKNEKILEACDYLSSCFADDSDFPNEQKQIYEFCQALWDMPERKKLHNWNVSIWEEVNKLQIEWLIGFIAAEKNIKKLEENLKLDNSQPLTWLTSFIEFLVAKGYESKLNLKTSPILPNQNGDFCIKDDLFLDSGEIDETLKDIAANLGYDFRDELLDKDIFLVLPTNRVRTQEQVAEEIAKLIKPLFAELPRRQETKQIFKALYIWFNKNKLVAENIFEELYKNKHKLYNDEEIAENMQKAEMLDGILSEQGMTLDDLLKLATKGKLKGLLSEKQETPKPTVSIQDALINLGITTTEELEKALKDRSVYENFSHISTASYEMLQYVLSLIEQAKENVKKHLSQLPEYNITNWREIATTVITGVAKNGNPINIVVRPSQGGQVVFYYSSEKDTLEKASAELWIDDDKTAPQHLTLGKILKRNRIDRISV